MQSNLALGFLGEADDLLAEIEAAALLMASGERSMEVVNELFRAFHTIKGSGAMFGFEEVASFAHHVESLLDEIRDARVAVSAGLASVILASKDHIRRLFLASQGAATVDPREEARVVEQIRRLALKTDQSSESQNRFKDEAEAAARTWRICFRPGPTILSTGCDPLLVFRDLRQLGECIVEGHSDTLPPLPEMQTDVCHLWWTVQLTTATKLEEIRDVFLFVESGSKISIEAVKDVASSDDEAIASKRESGSLTGIPQPVAKESIVRVPVSKLDRLVSMVGELVMTQSRLSAAARSNAAELSAPVEDMERLIGELREDVLRIRMMPIGTILGNFRRLVYELSLQLGKEIELVTEGEETELDKSILDQLGEPLMHLLRNSIDHGIEPGDERERKGKPRRGRIRLAASHRGRDVVVCVEDDGAGLDTAGLRAKAVAKGIIEPDANLSEKEIFSLILLPGFSTAKSVTSVSGRGVGMDVVKREMDALGGSINLTSEPGKGTCVALTLQLTLAIIEGLLLEVGESLFILPTAVVTENVELARSDRLRNGCNLIEVGGELQPYIDLRGLFQIEGSETGVSRIVVARHGEELIGIAVDRVAGMHHAVIQPIGKFFRHISVISGFTVMGDGRVALILDIGGITRLAEREWKQNGALARRPKAAA